MTKMIADFSIEQLEAIQETLNSVGSLEQARTRVRRVLGFAKLEAERNETYEKVADRTRQHNSKWLQEVVDATIDIMNEKENN